MDQPFRNDRFSLRRWSERKLEAARTSAPPDAPTVPSTVAPAPVAAPPAAAPATSPAATPPAAPDLPPLDTLTFESDFSAFLQPAVSQAVRQQALKKLFNDPRFNVMDGLDVYIDDYSIPSPLEPELIEQLLHARFTLNPPQTRVNAQGYVEDVPLEEAAAATVEADAEDAASDVASADTIAPPPLQSTPAETPETHTDQPTAPAPPANETIDR